MRECKNCKWAKLDPHQINWISKLHYILFKVWPCGDIANILCDHPSSREPLDNLGNTYARKCLEVRDRKTTGCTNKGIYFQRRETTL